MPARSSRPVKPKEKRRANRGPAERSLVGRAVSAKNRFGAPSANLGISLRAFFHQRLGPESIYHFHPSSKVMLELKSVLRLRADDKVQVTVPLERALGSFRFISGRDPLFQAKRLFQDERDGVIIARVTHADGKGEKYFKIEAWVHPEVYSKLLEAMGKEPYKKGH